MVPQPTPRAADAATPWGGGGGWSATTRRCCHRWAILLFCSMAHGSCVLAGNNVNWEWVADREFGEVEMTGLEALQSVQYVTVKGKRFVVLDAEDWEALIEWLEALEDLEIAREALVALQRARGDREKAGWLPWEEIRGELE